jgi:hypothetical protein
MHLGVERIFRMIKPFAQGLSILAFAGTLSAQVAPTFKVLGFSTSKDDAGHISYEHEANQWLPKMGKQYGFTYDSTKVWSDCNTAKLSQYQVVIFMDERPEDPTQRAAFQKYIEGGGGFIGCHGSAFELNGSQQPLNWNWYHNTFLGSGFLKLEDSSTVLTKGLPPLFKSSPNEWYRWKVADWTALKDIKILLSIDPSSYPLGTKAETNEIWTSGYYPVAWTNVKYHMLYVNMGHNDLNSPEANGKDSQTFANDIQNKLFINALLSFGGATTTGITPVTGAKAANPQAELRRNGSRLTISTPVDGFDVQTFDMLGQRIESGAKASLPTHSSAP